MFSSKRELQRKLPGCGILLDFSYKTLEWIFLQKKIPKGLSDFLIFELGATTFFLANSFLYCLKLKCTHQSRSRLPMFRVALELGQTNLAWATFSTPSPPPPFRPVMYEHFWVGLKPFSSQSDCYQLWYMRFSEIVKSAPVGGRQRWRRFTTQQNTEKRHGCVVLRNQSSLALVKRTHWSQSLLCPKLVFGPI